jgi:hypothetical protein
MTHSSGVFGSASTDTRLSFSVNETMRDLPEAFAFKPLELRT